MRRSHERPDGYPWPGAGLVLGGGIGSIVGMLVDPPLFFIGTGAGAGLGLVIGAIVQQWRPR